MDLGSCRTSLLKAQKHSFGRTGSSQVLLGHGDNATLMVLSLAVTDMVSWKTNGPPSGGGGGVVLGKKCSDIVEGSI